MGSVSSHSLKSFASLVEDTTVEKKKKVRKGKKDKKKKKEKKEKPPEKPKRPIFPSKSATMSPAIPEVEVEEFPVRKIYLFDNLYYKRT